MNGVRNGAYSSSSDEIDHRRWRSKDRSVKASLEVGPCQKTILTALLRTAHFLFWVVEGLWLLWSRLWNRLNLMRCLKNGRSQNRGHRHEKRPVHVAFAILETGSLSFPDLANLAVWAFLEAGIEHVSFYDVQGRIKAGCGDLCRAIKEATKSSKTLDQVTVKIRTNEAAEATPELFLPRIPTRENQKTVVQLSLLDESNGRGDLSSAAVEIAEKVLEGALDPERINERTVQEFLRTNKGMPDPDLLVRFGLVSSNMGFLPWQVRLTEIHDLPTHKDVAFSQFWDVLGKFSDCDQRFGR